MPEPISTAIFAFKTRNAALGIAKAAISYPPLANTALWAACKGYATSGWLGAAGGIQNVGVAVGTATGASSVMNWAGLRYERRQMAKLSDRLNAEYSSGSRARLTRHNAFDQFSR